MTKERTVISIPTRETPVWNWMMISFQADTNRGTPQIGPGDLSHGDAREAIQQVLSTSGFPIAEVWRRGAKDNTVWVGDLVFTIYSHEPGRSFYAACDWLRDFASIAKSAGALG